MPMLERDDVQEILDGEFAETARGRGSVVLIEGPIGSGRTSLLHAFGDRAAASDAIFLSATGSHAERHLPLGVIQQLFHNGGGDLAEAGLHWPAEPASTSETPVQIWEEACLLLLRLAERRPVVIGVDDLENADPASLRCLLYITRRIRSARVLVVLTETIGLGSTDPFLRAELVRQPRCRRLILPLLSPEGVGHMIGRELGVPVDHPLREKAFAVTGGNPVLVRGLAEDNRQRAAGGDEGRAALSTQAQQMPGETARLGEDPADDDGSGSLVIGTAFIEGVLTCLYRCDPAIVRVAYAIAVLDGEWSPARVAALAGSDMRTVTRCVEALTAAGLLEDGKFRHPTVRAAVFTFVADGDRTEFHRRAAELLHRDGACLTSVAEQLLAAGNAGEPWNVAVLDQAADQALAGGDPAAAVEYLKLASVSCADAAERLRLDTRIVEVASVVDRTTASRYLPRLLTAAREKSLSGATALVGVRLLAVEGRVEEAISLLHDALALPDAWDSRSRADGQALCASLSVLYPSHTAELRRMAEQAMPVLHGSPASLARGPGALTAVESAATVRPDPDDLIRSTPPEVIPLDVQMVALSDLVHSGRIDAANSWLRVLLGAARRRGAVVWHAFLTAMQATVALRYGDVAAAERHSRAAMRILPPREWGVMLGIPVAVVIIAATATGRSDVAARELTRSLPEATFETPIGLFYTYARAQYHLAGRQPRIALTELESCGRAMSDWGIDHPSIIPWRSEAARALLQLNRPGRARTLIEEQLALVAPHDLRTRGISLRMLAATSGPRDRARLLAEAADALRRSGDQLNLAYVQADLHRLRRGLTDHRDDMPVVDNTGPGRHQCPPAVRRMSLPETRTGMPDLGLPAAPAIGSSELSSAEARVASLAADGCTNREIAGKLHITVSTVEQHLTKVYRKLKVNRRVDLRKWAGKGLQESA